jgi:CheY-like chemotaxis protein
LIDRMSDLPQDSEARASLVALVEDDQDMRETMKDLLESLGHEVCTAEDGERGIELIVHRQPHVALVDIHLPGIDGCEVAERVRAHLGPGRVRLIALSALAFAADHERSQQAGFEAHLVKPPDLDLLERLLAGSPERSK